MKEPQRSLPFLLIPLKTSPSRDEDVLIKFYEDNSSNYMAPEYRDFRFITLSANSFTAGTTLTDEEIEQAMGTPGAGASGDNEKRDFEQVLFDDKDGADKAYTDLAAGTSFADIILSTGSTPDDAANHSEHDGRMYLILMALLPQKQSSPRNRINILLPWKQIFAGAFLTSQTFQPQ